jgi:hypothetical protein
VPCAAAKARAAPQRGQRLVAQRDRARRGRRRFVQSAFDSGTAATARPGCSAAAREASSLTGATGTRTRKRSKKASSASSAGTSLLAPTTLISGVRTRPLPLSNSRSLSSVSSALRIAELALNTSSRKAMPAVGRKPSVRRS